MHVLGIDVGGSKTVCILADRDGRPLVTARGLGANLQSAGELALETALHGVMEETLGSAGVLPAAICLGIAGMDRPDDVAVVRRIMSRIGHKAKILIVNDALIALEAGIGAAPGIVVVAGTGSIAYGRDAGGRAARAGGWGHVLGDEGSGYWLGRHALQAVARAADGRGPATRLGDRILAHFGLSRPQDLVPEIYFRRSQPLAIAALSGLVDACAADGDPVAARILDGAADELVGAAQAVASRLHLTECPILLAGGVFRTSARLVAGVTARVTSALPNAAVQRLQHEPVAGAVRLALAHASGRAFVPSYDATRA